MKQGPAGMSPQRGFYPPHETRHSAGFLFAQRLANDRWRV
jgi:hypothetical protein